MLDCSEIIPQPPRWTLTGPPSTSYLWRRPRQPYPLIQHWPLPWRFNFDLDLAPSTLTLTRALNIEPWHRVLNIDLDRLINIDLGSSILILIWGLHCPWPWVVRIQCFMMSLIKSMTSRINARVIAVLLFLAIYSISTYQLASVQHKTTCLSAEEVLLR